MRGFSYGAATGGLAGAMLGGAPAFLAAGLVFVTSNGAVPFLPCFLGIWAFVAILAASAGAGIGYLVGRATEDE